MVIGGIIGAAYRRSAGGMMINHVVPIGREGGCRLHRGASRSLGPAEA